MMPSEMPGVKRQMLCDSTYLRYFKSSQSHKDRNCNSSCLGLRGGKEWRLLFNRYGVSVSLDEKSYESSYGYR